MIKVSIFLKGKNRKSIKHSNFSTTCDMNVPTLQNYNINYRLLLNNNINKFKKSLSKEIFFKKEVRNLKKDNLIT